MRQSADVEGLEGDWFGTPFAIEGVPEESAAACDEAAS